MGVLIAPLDTLSYSTAYALWVILPILCFYMLLYVFWRQSGSTAPWLLLAGLSLPFICANAFTAQTGTLIACFYLGIALCWRKYPAMAGICISAVIIKPQLGLLLPVALLAGRRWKSIVTLAIATVLLLAYATWWFGLGIWAQYQAILPWFIRFLREGFGPFSQLAAGPYLALHWTGWPDAAALAAQAVVTTAVIAITGLVFRRQPINEEGYGLQMGILATGALLATPHAMIYDSPLLVLGIAALLQVVWKRGWRNMGDLTVVTMTLLMPYFQPLVMNLGVPFAMITTLFFYATLVTLLREEKPALI